MEKIIEKYLKYTQKSDNSKVLEIVIPILAQELMCQLFASSTHTIYNQKNVSVELSSFADFTSVVRTVLPNNCSAMEMASLIVSNSFKSIANKSISTADAIMWISKYILIDNNNNLIAA